jgi:hypothetical protein
MVETTPLNIEAVNLDDEREVDAFHEAWIETGQAKVQDDLRRLGLNLAKAKMTANPKRKTAYTAARCHPDFIGSGMVCPKWRWKSFRICQRS